MQCPVCERRYRTELSAFGVVAVCSGCHNPFRIGDSRPQFDWKAAPGLAEDSWIGIEAPKETAEAKHCIFCETLLPEGETNCPSCGKNQITGVSRKHKKAESVEDKVPIASLIPWKIIGAVAGIIAFAAGLVWVMQSLSRGVDKMGKELTEQTLIGQAAQSFRSHGDPVRFQKDYRGRVTDANLPAIIQTLSARDAAARRAAILLIGCGDMTRLDLLVAAAGSGESREAALEAIEAVGPQKLVRLSNHDRSEVRQGAAAAIATLFRIKTNDKVTAALSRRTSADDKVRVINELCGPRPRAVGPFVIQIGDVVSPFEVSITQIGTVYFMWVVSDELRTSALASAPEFNIPIERWCRATQPGVDTASIRSMLVGSLRLSSPGGEAWQGELRLQAESDIKAKLPGFLPVAAPPKGQVVTAPIRLFRPTR